MDALDDLEAPICRLATSVPEKLRDRSRIPFSVIRCRKHKLPVDQKHQVSATDSLQLSRSRRRRYYFSKRRTPVSLTV